MGHIELWKNSKTLISQPAYDELESKEGKYSSEHIESYFTLFELLLAPKSNPLLAVKELHFAKQGFMTSGEFHSHIVKIAKRCKFPNPVISPHSQKNTVLSHAEFPPSMGSIPLFSGKQFLQEKE